MKTRTSTENNIIIVIKKKLPLCECGCKLEVTINKNSHKCNKFIRGHQGRSKEIQKKKKQTSLKNYGVENPFQSKEIQKKIKQTNLKNFGVENPRQSKEIQEKYEHTCLLKFGVNNPNQSEYVKEKRKQTNLEKYGTICSLNCKEIYNKVKQTCLKKYGVDHFSKTFNGRQICRENIIKLIEQQKLNGEPLGPRIGNQERECLNDLQQYTSYSILRNIPIIGYFPDGYIKKLKLVIEFDELWHQYDIQNKRDIQKDKDYYQINLTVFRISEYNWKNNKEQVINQFKELIECLELQ
jgi:very-short-patch-repair endonuclease